VVQLLDADGIEPGEATRVLDGVDPRFFTQLTPRQAARHLQLAMRQREAGTVADVAVSHYPLKGHSEVAVVAPDVPGALAAIAGIFTANRIDVLGAVVGHADDGGRGLALDLFFVRDLVGEAIAEDDPRWRRLEDDLRALFAAGTVDAAEVAALIAKRRPPSGLPPRFTPAVPTEIKFLQDGSEKATIVEVFTRDRVGVLYAITHTLTELGLDISLSKVSTEGEKVADVFYVTRGGAKITDAAETAAIVARLRQELESPAG
jgi:[protein-PII] uridylyltransferase